MNKQTCIVRYPNPPRSQGCCRSCSDTWAGEHKPLGQLTGGMPEWQMKYKTNPHFVFLLHRCVQGLSFCHASHLRKFLKSLSLSFCSWFIWTKFSMATVQKPFQGNYFVKLQTLSLPLVHNNLSIIVECYKATSYSLSISADKSYPHSLKAS